ncbi:MAG TPA: nitrous oxide reductase accessory protein NosL [Chitinophagaceae bacterium]|nr:nitrous oxide reductase accessory protein NosL [Chitinophagaceae bacterium]
MKQRLHPISRVLVAIASLALVAVFFFPAWRIDLFAPQYPEGLTMNIWINGLSGDVDVINGLNHYIGMKHISVSMFPEFKFLPFIVGLFMLLGLVVAITGRRKYLTIYLGLSVVGGILAMIDFYRWGYNYGHNLDPEAPIQVPGLGYQPPLIGHKRILNFDAYSFPDVGGWIVITAGTLAFAVWFADWWRHRRKSVKPQAITLPLVMASLACTIILNSCSIDTKPIQYGKDDCEHCKMSIIDPKYGAEIVTKKGKVYKFDDIICLYRFLHGRTVDETLLARKVVINAEAKNEFIDLEKAVYLLSPELNSPMGSNAIAFSSRESAQRFASGKNAIILKWTELMPHLATP